MKIDVLDKSGKAVSKMDLNDSVFGVEPNFPLISQYIKVYLTSQRQGTSKVKDRSEVRGGGKKPWAQKGTGRARHGSSRSPIWVGGGVAAGPRPRPWNVKMSKRMKRAAIVSILSLKNKKRQLKIIDKFEAKEPKTSDMSKVLVNVKRKGNTLIVLSENNLAIRRSLSNLKRLETALWENLNGYQLMKAKTVIFEKVAINNLQEKYSTK